MIKKTFGHCLVRWNISNFCLDIMHEKCFLRSPEFTVKVPETTEWEMGIGTSSDEERSIIFYLKRLNSGPRIVWANWTIDLKDSLGRTIVDYECESFFERKQKHEIDLESLREIVEIFINSEKDSIVIACDIFVKWESNESEKELIDAGLSSLSQDFRRMLKRGKYYDVVVRIDNKDIRAHKSILTRRNDSLLKLISNAGNAKTISLSDINAEAVETVITYLYTGNLQGILRNPSIALNKCIDFLEVEELKPYFLSDSVDISSNIQIDEACFRVLIPNFRQKNSVLSSEELTRSALRSTWRLHIYPRGYNFYSDFITVQAELVSAAGNDVACVELAALDVYNEAVNKAKVLGHLVAGEWFSFDQFLDRRSLDDILKQNQLRLVLKIRISKGILDSTIVSNLNVSQTIVRTLPHYLTLSAQMRSIFNVLMYKDVTLRAKGNGTFLAHRCILAARSKTFAKLLAKSTDDIVLDMEHRILRSLLQYIYCGVLEQLKTDELFQMYKTAEEYCIDALKIDCCKLLLSKLDVQTMHEIFAFADENLERDLKLTSYRFIEAYKNYTPDDAN